MPERQLELIPMRRRSARERRAMIRERLHGLEYRQAARAAKRREYNERRRKRHEQNVEADARQMTLEEVIARSHER